MKLSILRLANAAPCGPTTKDFFEDKEFVIEVYDDIKIRITHIRRGDQICTSFFNAVYWREIPEEKVGKVADTQSEPGTKPTRRGRAPQAEAQA